MWPCQWRAATASLFVSVGLQLRSEELLSCQVLVALMGEHRLKGVEQPMHLYTVVPQSLLPREVHINAHLVQYLRSGIGMAGVWL